MRSKLQMTAVLLLAPGLAPAAQLSRSAAEAFGTYVRGVETRQASQRGAPMHAPMPAGTVRVEPVNGGSWPVSGGLLHHWRAIALVPGASPRDLLTLLRDYNRLAEYYSPEVVSSRALSGDGNRAALAMRFKKQRVVTVVLDAEFEAESGLTGRRGYSVSRSTHIWQVDRPGSPAERRRPEGSDDGYLWRLNSYWSFEQTPEGLLMECEAVSLTRDVPAALSWLVMPIVETLPRTSLEFTLTATKNALADSALRRHINDRAN